MEMQFIRYNSTGATVYTESIKIKPVANCNGFDVVNTGTTIVNINGRILYPGVPGTNNGDAVTIGGNAGEIYVGNINIVIAAGVGGQCTVDQKFYIIQKQL